MLTKCVNPSCSSNFKHLREGRLLRVDRGADYQRHASTGRKNPISARSLEYYWLCASCSGMWNLAFDRGSGIVLIPLPNPAASSLLPPALVPRKVVSVA